MIPDKKLVIQKADGTDLELDLTLINQMEERLPEIRSLTTNKAVELRGLYNEACNILSKYIAWLKYEVNKVKYQLDLIRSEIILEKIPSDKKTNADTREAMVLVNPEYKKYKELLHNLQTVVELFTGKFNTFERAYWDCREMLQYLTKASELNLSVNGNEYVTVNGNEYVANNTTKQNNNII